MKAILFDVGGTLIKPQPSVGHIYSRVLKRHAITADPGIINNRFEDGWRKRENLVRAIDIGWWRDLVYEVLSPFAISEFDPVFEDIYSEFMKTSCWEIFPDVVPTLKELKNRKYVLGVASNWDNRLPALLDSLDLSKYFDYQFISYDLGMVKPNPNFFSVALETLKLPADQVCHVGDDAHKDGHAPQQLGIQSFLLSRETKGEGAVLASLSDLLTYLS